MSLQDSSDQQQRLQALQQWSRQALTIHLGSDPGPLHAASLGGDASFRRYFRCTVNGDTILLVDAPPARENNPAFVKAAAEFRAAGLCTPTIIATDLDQGFMILEDFGDLLYLSCLQQARQGENMARVQTLYRQATDALLALQTNDLPSELPLYSRELLNQEMMLFDQWFCEGMLGMTLSADEQTLLADTRDILVNSALAQPQTRVHRDYHSRNLMVRRAADGSFPEDMAPGVIDFQDAVIGAATYDLVSLLRDCYIVWPASQVSDWVGAYARQARGRSIIPASYTDGQFQRDFDLMGLQRHIKVLGIFCRLALRDGKVRYLDDLPVVINYVLEVAALHPEMADFLAWFRQGPAPMMLARLAAAGSKGAVGHKSASI